MFFEIFKYTDINKVEIISKFNSFTSQNTTRTQQKLSKNTGKTRQISIQRTTITKPDVTKTVITVELPF